MAVLKQGTKRGRWKCGSGNAGADRRGGKYRSGKCRSRQSMESHKNTRLNRGLTAAVSACAYQQFETHAPAVSAKCRH